MRILARWRHPVYLGIVFSLGGIFLICAWYFAGISGEVFLVNQNGRVLPAPGASIQIYRSGNTGKSVGTFLINDVSGNKKYTEDLVKVTLALQKAQHMELSAEKVNTLIALPEHIKLAYCGTLIARHSEYFGAPLESTNTDRNGRFSLRLTPGKYVIFVNGQAGNHQAVWLEDLKLRWRSEIRLVKPECDYSVE